MNRSISVEFIEEALECASRGGVDTASLLDSAGLHFDDGSPVTAAEFGKLWLAIANKMDDEFFGNADRAMRPGSFVLMGHAVLGSSNVEVAIRRCLRFLKVSIDEPYGVLSTRAGVSQITLKDRCTDRSAFAYRTYWILLNGLISWMAKKPIPIYRIELACAPPKNNDDYHDFFGAPVSFDQPKTRMFFRSDYLKIPINRSESSLKSFLHGSPGNFLNRYRSDDPQIYQIKEMLRRASAEDWPTFEETARTLAVSPSTLRRRLLAQGQSYQSLKNQERLRISLKLLKDGNLSISEIACKAGYAEPSAFYRAFKNWTGRNPRRENRLSKTSATDTS